LLQNAVFVIMKSKVKAGQNFTLEINYSGIPSEAKRPPWSGGFVWKKDNLDKPWDAVACETEGASLWWPCKDVMNDEPDSVDITLEVPAGLKAISNGKLIASGTETWESGDSNSFFSWHVSYPINIYNITFYIGNYKLLHDTYYSEVTHDTLQLNHYVLEQNYDKAVEHFKQLKCNGLLFTQYDCPQQALKQDLFSASNYIAYVLSGKRIFHLPGETHVMTEGKCVFAKKGGWIAEKEPAEGWCVLVFFIPDEYLKSFITEYRPNLPIKKDPTPPDEQMLDLQVNETSRSFFYSMLPYFLQEPPPPESLVELKFRELLFNMLINPANGDLGCMRAWASAAA